MYLIMTLRHKNIYGDGYAVFWGCGESKNGYSADVRYAHRFTKEEAEKIVDDEEIMLDIKTLGFENGQPPIECINTNIRVLVEIGTINRLYGLEI